MLTPSVALIDKFTFQYKTVLNLYFEIQVLKQNIWFGAISRLHGFANKFKYSSSVASAVTGLYESHRLKPLESKF